MNAFVHLRACGGLLPLHARHIERKNAEAFLKSSQEIVALAEENSQALASLPELRGINFNNPLTAMTISSAERLDGLSRHLAMQPCAVVLSDGAFLERPSPFTRQLARRFAAKFRFHTASTYFKWLTGFGCKRENAPRD